MKIAQNYRAFKNKNRPYESLRQMNINSMASATSANELLQNQPMPPNFSQENFNRQLNNDSALSSHQRNRQSMQESGNFQHMHMRNKAHMDSYTSNQNYFTNMQRANSMLVNSHRMKQRYMQANHRHVNQSAQMIHPNAMIASSMGSNSPNTKRFDKIKEGVQ